MKVAAVDISAGFNAKHTLHEYVDLVVVRDNIKRVGEMVTTKTEKFDYIEAMYDTHFSRGYYSLYGKAFIDHLYDSSCVEMMVLPGSCYIKSPDGSIDECDGQYFVDTNGNVYEYIDMFDAAVLLEGIYAFTANHTSVKATVEMTGDNNLKDALGKTFYIEVVDRELLRDFEDEMYGDSTEEGLYEETVLRSWR